MAGGLGRPPEENAMKAKTVVIILGVMLLTFGVMAAASAAGYQEFATPGCTFQEAQKQAPACQKPTDFKRTYVWVPMYVNGDRTAIPYNELCLAGDNVRRMSADGTSVDVGKAPAKKEYTVLVHGMNKGDEIIIGHQQVAIPACNASSLAGSGGPIFQ